MTSWRVRSSISWMRAGIELAGRVAAHARGGARRARVPSRSIASQAASSTSSHVSVPSLIAPERAQFLSVSINDQIRLSPASCIWLGYVTGM